MFSLVIWCLVMDTPYFLLVIMSLVVSDENRLYSVQ